MRVEFGLLGELRATVGGMPVELGSPRQRAVLAALLADVGHPVPAAGIILRVWGDAPPETVSVTLRAYLSRLRALGFDISRHTGGYVLRAEPCAVDVLRFNDLIAEAGRTGQSATYRQALELWRGEPFAGIAGLDVQRKRLEAARFGAVLDYHDALLAEGTYQVDELTELSVAHPADERVAGQLITALLATGRHAEALARYEKVRGRLADELGADPGVALRELGRLAVLANSVPRQLPAPPPLFSGRTAELAVLDSARPADTVVISAIGGAGGVGKTWLALHWAHRHLAEFPDGQLYVNLRGFDPAAPPVEPATVLRDFLDALGVAAAERPSHVDAQAALFRELVADRKMLVLLDNARESAQVEPLLPGGRTCTVIVTSRHQLSGLVSAHGAMPLSLDVLNPADARAVLIGHIGAGRVAAEPAAVTALLGYCAGLPLALGIVGARAAAHTGLAELAAELEDAAGRLDGLGDADANLRAVLSWSYAALSPQAAALFGLLGLHPGADIGLAAVGSLAGQPAVRLRKVMRELESAHLVTQHAADRYRMHDLVRLYAAEVAVPDAEASRRLADHYAASATAAERTLFSSRTPLPTGPVAPRCVPEDPADPHAWFAVEHANILAVQRFAIDHQLDEQAWQCAWALTTYHTHSANIADQLAVWRVALEASQRMADAKRETFARRYIATSLARTGAHGEAMHHLDQALAVAERVGDNALQAQVHYVLSDAWATKGDNERALEHAAKALRYFEHTGKTGNIAQGLTAVGWFSALTGRYASAREHCERALAIFEANGNQAGEAGTLDTLGYIAFHSGDFAAAVSWYERSIAVFREVGDQRYEATVLDHLGDAHRALGRLDEARAAFTLAAELLRAQGRSDEAHTIDEKLR
jgi:DNA-binding SARP family transcriptional activator/tetratricopeptide (TPR) repeat protein